MEDDPTIIPGSAVLERTYRDGGALDVEALCVVGGEACWQVALNVSLLIDRGNALEAMTLERGGVFDTCGARVATDGRLCATRGRRFCCAFLAPLTRLPVAVPVVIDLVCGRPASTPIVMRRRPPPLPI